MENAKEKLQQKIKDSPNIWMKRKYMRELSELENNNNNFYQVGDMIKCGHCEPNNFQAVEPCECNCHKETSKCCNASVDDRGIMVVDFYCTKCKKSLLIEDINNYKGY